MTKKYCPVAKDRTPDALVKHNVQTVADLLDLEDVDDVFEYEDDF